MTILLLQSRRTALRFLSRSKSPKSPRIFKHAFLLLQPNASDRNQRSALKPNLKEIRSRQYSLRNMSISHEERTAAEPRDNEIHDVVLSEIVNVTENVRLLKLRPPDKSKPGIQFLILGF